MSVTMVAEAINSRMDSKSLSWLANEPTDLGNAASFMFISLS